MSADALRDRRLAALASLGLAEGEARVYVALLEAGPATARDVARRAKVPRNRVYGLLESLAARSLVDVRLDGVRTFAARGIEEHLAAVRRRLETERAALEARRVVVQRLFDEGRAPAPPAGETLRVARGRRDAADLLVRLLLQARHRVLCVTTVATSARLLNHVAGSDALPALVASGVDVRWIAGGAGAEDPRARQVAAALGDRVRFLVDAPALHRIVVDGREVALLAPSPDDERVYIGDDVALVSDDPALVAEAEALAFLVEHGMRASPDAPRSPATALEATLGRRGEPPRLLDAATAPGTTLYRPLRRDGVRVVPSTTLLAVDDVP